MQARKLIATAQGIGFEGTECRSLPKAITTSAATQANATAGSVNARQRSAGARMLEWANRLATYAYLVDRDVNGDPIYGPDGLPTFQLDANGKAQKDPANPGADAALTKFVDSVQMMEQLAATFAQPVDWLPEP